LFFPPLVFKLGRHKANAMIHEPGDLPVAGNCLMMVKSTALNELWAFISKK
jgi:hypothetical protein